MSADERAAGMGDATIFIGYRPLLGAALTGRFRVFFWWPRRPPAERGSHHQVLAITGESPLLMGLEEYEKVD